MNNVKFNKEMPGWILVTIDDLPHLLLSGIVAAHSYINADLSDPMTNRARTRWFIEFYLDSGQTIKAEYDNRELWETILRGL